MLKKFIFLLAILFFGMSRSDSQEFSLRVAVFLPSSEGFYFSGIRAGLEREASHINADGEILGINFLENSYDEAVEIAQLEAVLADGIDAVILVPISPDSISLFNSYLNESGIPFFVIGEPVEDVNVVSFITSDSAYGGELLASYLENLGINQVASFEPLTSWSSALELSAMNHSLAVSSFVSASELQNFPEIAAAFVVDAESLNTLQSFGTQTLLSLGTDDAVLSGLADGSIAATLDLHSDVMGVQALEVAYRFVTEQQAESPILVRPSLLQVAPQRCNPNNPEMTSLSDLGQTVVEEGDIYAVSLSYSSERNFEFVVRGTSSDIVLDFIAQASVCFESLPIDTIVTIDESNADYPSEELKFDEGVLEFEINVLDDIQGPEQVFFVLDPYVRGATLQRCNGLVTSSSINTTIKYNAYNVEMVVTKISGNVSLAISRRRNDTTWERVAGPNSTDTRLPFSQPRGASSASFRGTVAGAIDRCNNFTLTGTWSM